MNRAPSIRSAVMHSAIRSGMPEHIARTMAARAIRLNRAGHTAHRAMRLADDMAKMEHPQPGVGKS